MRQTINARGEDAVKDSLFQDTNFDSFKSFIFPRLTIHL